MYDFINLFVFSKTADLLQFIAVLICYFEYNFTNISYMELQWMVFYWNMKTSRPVFVYLKSRSGLGQVCIKWINHNCQINMTYLSKWMLLMYIVPGRHLLQLVNDTHLCLISFCEERSMLPSLAVCDTHTDLGFWIHPHWMLITRQQLFLYYDHYRSNIKETAQDITNIKSCVRYFLFLNVWWLNDEYFKWLLIAIWPAVSPTTSVQFS